MYKKLLMPLIIIVLLIAGCTNSENIKVEPTIEENRVEKNESITLRHLLYNHDMIYMLKAAGISFPIIHELNRNELELESIELSVDYYEDGKFDSTVISVNSHPGKSERLIFYALYNPLTETEAKWVLTIEGITDHSRGSGSSSTIHKTNVYRSQSSTVIDNIDVKIDEEVILGYIGRNSMNLSLDLDYNIANNEQLFVIKCKFY